MILPDFKAFPRIGRIICVDWGARRVGVAVSDPGRGFVFARPVVSGGDDLPTRIAKIATDECAVGIIIGLPLRTDGSESDTTAHVREFANALANVTDLPIAFIDETLSSNAAMETIGRATYHNIKEKLDSESARVILENAISMIRRA
ncbi:MAG: Holliday junction resolvase RuvX [Alphaproteobacteria bacterium]|nr:Holliday junction resolvase RuvX [Alphaproteobacteria bacterium]